MAGLFSTMQTGANALRALDQALQVSQNNVSNASTPGYAKQVATLDALPFQLSSGLTGGVQAGDPKSARDQYLEQAVRVQAELFGDASAQSEALSTIEGIFSIDGQSGINGALNNLFQSFSAWSASPDSSTARQDVLTKAQDLAHSFQDATSALSLATSSINQQIDGTVQQINGLASQIRDYNVKIRANGQADAGIDAQIHTALESLSGLTGITARFESDGTVTVLLGGQSPLVMGDQAYALTTSYADAGSPANPGATPAAHILDSNGQDAAEMISHGTLGGLLTVRNTVLPSLQGDGQQAGALNILAKQVADRVNALLQSGTTSANAPGVPLFAYDGSSAAKVAASLTLDPGALAANLAPVSVGPPPVSNGIALALANLGTSTDPADQINGKSILDFYGTTAANVGSQTAAANNGRDSSGQALAQARGFRSQITGVSLDEEAVRLTELQRGYQAASKLISVMDSLVQTLIDMVPVS